jgi:hypothetical protein
MGGKQLGFSDYELTPPKKQTKREKFLAEMEVVYGDAGYQGIAKRPEMAGKAEVDWFFWTGPIVSL